MKEFNNLETPFYYYDLVLLQETIDALTKEANSYNYHVHYALKANFDFKILSIIKKAGLGIDCVSGNEIVKAIEAGFIPDQIVFAGVGKSDKEITYGLENSISFFNCESEQEILVINELAEKLNKKATIALRINPNIAVDTHHYITTGLKENKFGINISDLKATIDLIKGLKNIKLNGVHFHLGSQITDLGPYIELSIKSNTIVEKIEKMLGSKIEHINLGGGLGIDYQNPKEHPIPDFKSYFSLFNKHLKLSKGQQVHFELGRSIVGQCGSLISRVLYTKKGEKKDFLILDAGMTELIRPALYQSYHKIENISNTSSDATKTYTVVGPICESSDVFSENVNLPETKRGDLIRINSTGAYGEVMSSNYNLRDKARVIYSD